MQNDGQINTLITGLLSEIQFLRKNKELLLLLFIIIIVKRIELFVYVSIWKIYYWFIIIIYDLMLLLNWI